ncbi:ankyrin repeat domain-containing protein [Pedobacter sp.]|uniref:ankyrin repeat domain-containing protein n=1 Tax=Pedobacter sp. TaxID=1411316 RepID=UPI003D7F36FE
MKKIFTVLFTLASFAAVAQQNTLLNQSFWQGTPSVEVVKAEIAKGNDPAQFNANAMDPVVLAINSNAPLTSITYLLDLPGNDINKLTHDGRTYLHWAAMRGNAELIAYLLNKGAKTNIFDSHGSTPLLVAASSAQQDTKLFDLFISHGVNLKSSLNQDGANALLLAISSDKDFTLTNYFISKGLDLKSVDAAGNNAFAYAAKSGNVELMKATLAKGVQVSQQAMLMTAQGGGRRASGPTAGLPVYQYLESIGVKPLTTSKTGQNVLHYLVRKPEQAEVIKYFVDKGVDVNNADEDGLTPLMNAAAANREPAVFSLLLPKIKNINQATPQGQTALSIAVKSNSPEVISLLINKGADVKVLDAKGNNLLFYAMEGYTTGRQAGANKLEELAAKLNLLKAQGLALNAAQQNGNTLYHLAVAKNDLALLQHLQPLGIDINAKNQEGISALHKAAMIAKDDVILKYLISIGAKKDIGTSFEETAYELATANETLTKNKVSVDFLK